MAKKTTNKQAPSQGKKTGKSTKAEAKKTTRKKVTKKSTTASSGKTTKKKSTTKKPTTKKSAAKTSTKKVTKKKTTQKTAAGKKVSKKVAKKTTNKASQTEAASAVDPKNNGKANAQAVPPPSTLRRVVRPEPPKPQEEPGFEDWTPLSDAKLKRVKTGLTRKDLRAFQLLLLEKRAEIVGDVMGMEEARSAGGGGDLSNMPLHMADIGSDNYEQEFTLGLVESERKLLIEIDRALLRIQNRTYGVCIITGTPIPKARLEIKPWAKYSIEIVREREKRGLHSF